MGHEKINQGEVMRWILKILDKDPNKSAEIAAKLEDLGVLPRISNVDGWPSLRYRLSHARNELRKHSHLIDALPSPH